MHRCYINRIIFSRLEDISQNLQRHITCDYFSKSETHRIKKPWINANLGMYNNGIVVSLRGSDILLANPSIQAYLQLCK